MTDALFDVPGLTTATGPAPSRGGVYPPGVEVQRAARLSEDGRYRYVLGRTWGPGADRAVFVMLNPSTADATVDDPTIRRCVGFARSLGCDSLSVVNLYAWRATDPAELWTAEDPVGPRNDEYLARHLTSAVRMQWPLIAAWGAHARPDRVAALRALPGSGRLTALGVTKSGAPRHPLYLPATARPVPWSGR